MAGRITQLLGGRSIVIALIVACAYFMENLDGTIIVTALPQMADSFHIDATRMSLGITAYMLAVAACITASGWAADRVGARTLFCAAIGVFTLASMLCGMAPNFFTFIAARILQGAAAAMMSPVGRLVVLRTSEKKDLLRALSTLVWPGLIAPVLGPPLGGFITSALNWRWIFFVNLPVGLLGMALVLAFVPEQKTEQKTPFDPVGFLITAVALACMTYGLDMMSLRDPAHLGGGAVLLLAAVVTGWMSVRHMQKAKTPLVPLDALKLRTFFVACVSGGVITRIAISATPFIMPLMFQLGFGLSPVQSGLILLVYTAANLLMKTITNPILKKWGIRRVLMWNGVICSAAIALCALVTPGTPMWISAIVLVVAGASRSMQFTSVTMVTFADVKPDQRPASSVFFSLTQQIGQGAGVAAGALFLALSQIALHHPQPKVIDFQVGLVLSGVLSAIALISYRTIARDAGDEISGYRQPQRA